MTWTASRAARVVTGLRGRMALAFVVTSLATLGAATLVVVPPLERRLVSDRLDELRSVARTIRPELRAIPLEDRVRGGHELERIADRLQRRTGGRIAIFDHTGAELADVGPARRAAPLVEELARERAVAVAARRRDSVTVADHGDLAFAMTTAGGERDPLTLVIAKRLTDTRAAAAVVRAALPGALAAGLLAALVFALLLSRGLLRRLSRLQDDARALGAEGLSHPVTVSGGDEVAVVAEALEAMRERLVEEQASRQDFVSTASHELRTPLASLQATLELLKEQALVGPADPEAIAARADIALRQTHRLVGLASDLLELSRVDGDAPLDLEPIDLAELARTISREFEARLESAGRALRVEGGPAVASADPAAAARILRVLLDNATNYGADAVNVTLARENGCVRVAVDDGGPGLAADERERVFRRFARGRAAAGAGAGAGLGLAIARGLARSMGGDVEAPEGARFVLTLPAS
jgi:signal transduction histidine kinase